jgi:hypothetical protein
MTVSGQPVQYRHYQLLAASRLSSPTKKYGGNNQNDYDNPAG